MSTRISNNQIKKAGKKLKLNPTDGASYAILSEFRSNHRHQLNTIYLMVKRHSKSIYKNSSVSQRLKRMPSIIYKLKAEPTMALSNMADIGGCRAVLNSLQSVYKCKDAITTSNIKHKFVKKLYKDYIKSPKKTGYRGIHLVYNYFSDKNPKFNDYQIEIQLRTELQHAWSTTIETVDFFLNKGPDEKLKAGTGDQQWQNFFYLTSLFIADKEKTGSFSQKNLNDLKKLINKLKVKEVLRAYQLSLKNNEDRSTEHDKFTVLVLDKMAKKLWSYYYEDEDKAYIKYQEEEFNRIQDNNFDVLYIANSSLKDLRKIYPNYYADTSKFIDLIENV